jgi:molecular chaperone Hsp33
LNETASDDQVLRSMTDDHAFRVIVADTTRTARAIVEAQKVAGLTARNLAELVTATVLVRETMAPTYRVQGIVKGAGGKGTLVGDAFPDGGTRGLAQLEGGTHVKLGAGARLQMMRSLPNGSVQQGIVEVDEAGFGESLMKYLQISEQVVSCAALGVLFASEGPNGEPEGEILAAGGYVVQLLPEAERGLHAVMTARLEDFPPIKDFLGRDGFGAKLLMDEIAYAMPHTMLGESPVHFACRCSEPSLLAALASLGRAEIESLVSQGESIEVQCDYCHKDYVIAPERLRSLLHAS